MENKKKRVGDEFSSNDQYEGGRAIEIFSSKTNLAQENTLNYSRFPFAKWRLICRSMPSQSFSFLRLVMFYFEAS